MKKTKGIKKIDMKSRKQQIKNNSRQSTRKITLYFLRILKIKKSAIGNEEEEEKQRKKKKIRKFFGLYCRGYGD